MNKRLKQDITNYYTPPSPQRKQEFLKSLNYPKTRWHDFLFTQLGYISKRVWVVSIFLFSLILCLGTQIQHKDMKMLWVVSAIVPFMAMLAITEIARSSVYGMSELEMTTRYSLRSLLLGRMSIVGTGNLLLFLVIIPFVSGEIEMNVLKVGVYVLVPYLITCFVSFCLVNHIQTGDITYYCAGAAMGISVAGLFVNSLNPIMYHQKYFMIWLFGLVLLLLAVYREFYRLIKNTEELQWNLFSTV